MTGTNSLRSGRVRNVLDRLHAEARGDRFRILTLVPRFASGLLRGQKLWDILTPEAMKDFYIPVSREQGEFLYLTARATGATKVVEYGTSFGISTLYLAAAVRDNGGGQVIGTEIEASKAAVAERNLKDAGLDELVDVRLGDAMETLRDVPEPIDLVLLDGWKDLYVPILDLMTPRLRPGAVILADNIFTFRRSLRPYVETMQSGERGFASTTLHLADGFEYSIYLGKR
jgi:predicted O-methyltransferase YrrM